MKKLKQAWYLRNGMHGPYGVVIRYRKPSNISDSDIEKSVGESHKMIKSIPGFRSVLYFNVNEEDYAVAVAFYTEKAADDAIEPIRERVQARIPEAVVSKAEVAPGDFVDEFIAKDGQVQRNM